MDKTTKAFVIGACSVVMAVPVLLIANGFLEEWERRSNIRENKEKVRQIRKARKTAQKRSQRFMPCFDRADELFELSTRPSSSERNRKQMWIDQCISSTAPVDEVPNLRSEP